MKSSKNTIMIILMLIIFCRQAFTQNTKLDSISGLEQFEKLAQKGPWEIAKQKKGVTLSIRKLQIADTLNIRELSVSFAISATLNEIVEYIKQPSRIQEWNEGVKYNTLLENQDSTWVSHTTFKIPYPFPQQELIARYSVNRDNEKVVVSSQSIPDYMDLKEGMQREKYNWCKWVLLAKGDGIIQVTFSAVSLTDTPIPRFIKDPIIKRKLFNSFVNLKERLSRIEG